MLSLNILLLDLEAWKVLCSGSDCSVSLPARRHRKQQGRCEVQYQTHSPGYQPNPKYCPREKPFFFEWRKEKYSLLPFHEDVLLESVTRDHKPWSITIGTQQRWRRSLEPWGSHILGTERWADLHIRFLPSSLSQNHKYNWCKWDISAVYVNYIYDSVLSLLILQKSRHIKVVSFLRVFCGSVICSIV